jgi:carbon storage regulator
MLILTRKIGESIVIGSNIHVMLVAVQGDNVRIGISAPKDIVVDRQEIAEKRNHWLSKQPAAATPLPLDEISGRLHPPPV